MTNVKIPIHEWLQDLRDKARLSQSEVDVETKKLGGRVSQGYLSQLEKGYKTLDKMEPAKLDALRRVYNVSLEEWAERTGLTIVTAETLPLSASQSKPRLRPIPTELQQMIDENGHLAEELHTERWQQYLAGQRFSTGSASPERWWNLFLTLKNAGIEPGGN